MPSYYDEKTKTWFCKFYYTDYTGCSHQKKKRGFKLQREAKEWERSFLEHQQSSPDITFLTLYDNYIEDIEHRLKESTLKGKINVFKNRILPYFKEKPINAITPKDIREWQNAQIAKKYSNAYLDRINNMMVTIMNYAVLYYHLQENPCNKAGHMGKRTRSMKFWTLDQYNKVLQYVTDITARIALQVLFYSGMRFGEMLALTLNDLDFENNTITIDKNLPQNSKGTVTPKSENGTRVVTMPAAIMEELEAYTQRLYCLTGEQRIFTFTRSLIRGTMQRCSKQANVPFIRIHDLRHSPVSLLIDLEFTPHLIAERIGDTVQMVNNTYGHLYPNRHAEAAEKLNSLIVPK